MGKKPEKSPEEMLNEYKKEIEDAEDFGVTNCRFQPAEAYMNYIRDRIEYWERILRKRNR